MTDIGSKWKTYSPTPTKEKHSETDKILESMASEFAGVRQSLGVQTAETIERLAGQSIQERLVPQAIQDLAAQTVQTQTAGAIEAARRQAHEAIGQAAADEVALRGAVLQRDLQREIVQQFEQSVKNASLQFEQSARKAVGQVQDVGERAMQRLEESQEVHEVERTVTRDGRGLIQSITGGGVTKTLVRDINGYVSKIIEEPS